MSSSFPRAARHRCKKKILNFTKECTSVCRIGNVLRRLQLQQLPYIGNIDLETDCILYPFLGFDDPLPPFLALFVLSNIEQQRASHVSDHARQNQQPVHAPVGFVNLSQETGQISYILVSFGNCGYGLDNVVAKEAEADFLNELRVLTENAAVAEAGHALWMKACYASRNISQPQPSSEEMNQLISHLEDEFLVPLTDLDTKLLPQLLVLQANWQQVGLFAVLIKWFVIIVINL